MGKRVGIVLSGCGVFDGAEIHESVLTLLYVDQAGAEPILIAPDIEQAAVIDHETGTPMPERRNVLKESARIARGSVRKLSEVSAETLDAVIFPGGFGAAKNLSDFATRGAQAQVHPDVARLVRQMHAARKPQGFICIAPALAAATFRGTSTRPRLTIGTDPDTTSALEKMGARPAARKVDEIEVDAENLIVSTPAYMLAGSISEAARGIEKLVSKVIELAQP